MMEWIKCEDELPPCDDYYWVTNDPIHFFAIATCFYDGIGFTWDGIYRPVEYWCFKTPTRKKYGKQK